MHPLFTCTSLDWRVSEETLSLTCEIRAFLDFNKSSEADDRRYHDKNSKTDDYHKSNFLTALHLKWDYLVSVCTVRSKIRG
jgi:hypothetical protein